MSKTRPASMRIAATSHNWCCGRGARRIAIQSREKGVRYARAIEGKEQKIENGPDANIEGSWGGVLIKQRGGGKKHHDNPTDIPGHE